LRGRIAGSPSIRICAELFVVARPAPGATYSYTVRRSSLLVSLSAALLGIVAACSSASEADDGAASTEQGIASNVHVLTSRNDNARTAANAKEKILKHATVNAQTFGRVWSRPVDGQIYAQPLYVGGVNGKNVVYVATEHNSVYAFDADDTRATAPALWE
jgi:outer membrane protein assembly factor BamB